MRVYNIPNPIEDKSILEKAIFALEIGQDKVTGIDIAVLKEWIVGLYLDMMMVVGVINGEVKLAIENGKVITSLTRDGLNRLSRHAKSAEDIEDDDD